MKQKINVFEYAQEIVGALPKGVLLTTKRGGTVNSMTIAWGALGVEWGESVFIAFVREGRFTRELLDESREFTVNIPYGTFDKKILGYCGSRSGREMDKARDLGLTLVESEEVAAPGILELPLTLECKVLYHQMQDRNAIPESIRKAMYPEDVDGSHPMENRDYHVAYYGKIVRAYILQ